MAENDPRNGALLDGFALFLLYPAGHPSLFLLTWSLGA